MTARDCAKDLIRHYVERGDAAQDLVAGGLGCACGEYWANIGGYARITTDDEPVKLKRHQIAVTQINREECLHIFDLYELYDEIKHGEQQSLL